jgi:hypothetical protein
MATVPSPITFVATAKLTAAQMNTNVRDAVNFLVAKPAVKVHNSTAQSIPTATWTSITWDTEDLDNDGMHSTSTNAQMLVAATAGWYMVTANAEFAINGTGQRLLRISDGGGITIFGGSSAGANSATTVTLSCSALVFLLPTNIVMAQVYQSSGGALSMGAGAGATSLSAVWMHS